MLNHEIDPYAELLSEFRHVMHQSAWRLGWNFFFLFVGLLPLMYFFIWMIGPSEWELTLFHTPVLMLVGSVISLLIVVILLFKIYKDNLELEALKNSYLVKLSALKSDLDKQNPPLV